ncbi:MAG: WD40/YVTN/BNR-like repeat-containing protein, partial [Flavobacteriales bacterium]
PFNQIRGYKQFSRLNHFYLGKLEADGTYNPMNEWRGYSDWLEDYPQPTNGRAANWTNFGPATSPPFAGLPFQEGIGRIARISFHPTNADIFYVGATIGGLWKTTDGGSSYTPIGDFLPANLQAGDVVTDPSNHNTLYFATSNGDQFGGGAGIYKSTNQGSSWSYLGLSGLKIDRLVMDPSDNTHLWAAGAGGLWESTDSGVNWTHHASFTSGYVNEFVYQPGSSTTLFLTHNNGTSSQFYRSTDSGVNWTAVALPQAGTLFTQIEMDVTPNDANYIYLFGAAGTAADNYIFKSTDAGLTWSTIASNSTSVNYEDNSLANANMFDHITVYPGRCVMIACSPTDKDEVYVGGAFMTRTLDGGATWKDHQVANGGGANNMHHADNIWMDWSPVNGNQFFLCDGGIYERSGTVTDPVVDIANGLKITESYWINTSHDGSKFICGNQDNGTFLYNGSSWMHIGSGDGMVCFFDPGDNNTSYHSYQNGLGLGRITNGAANGGEQAGDQTNLI